MTFSIIVPIYKAEKYLSDCIESVLYQSFSDFELLLIVDGSPDNSIMICNEYALKDSRIRVFNRENQGVAKTRNFGIEQAKGAYVAFLDADDYWHSDYLKKVLVAFKQYEGCEVCTTGYWRTKECTTDKLICNKLNNKPIHIIENYPHQWIFCNCIITSAVCVTRQLLLKVGMFKEGVKIAEDLDLWIRLNFHTGFIYINDALMYYRVATENSSSKVCGLSDFFPFEKWYKYPHRHKNSLDLMTSIQLYRNYKLSLIAKDRGQALRYFLKIKNWTQLLKYLIQYRIIKRYL